MKIRFSISRDGVPTSRIEDVAAREAADAEPHSAQGSVFFDGLHHVDRAGRLEAAHRGEQRREEALKARYVAAQEARTAAESRIAQERASLKQQATAARAGLGVYPRAAILLWLYQ